jgi:hypothetical protein
MENHLRSFLTGEQKCGLFMALSGGALLVLAGILFLYTQLPFWQGVRSGILLPAFVQFVRGINIGRRQRLLSRKLPPLLAQDPKQFFHHEQKRLPYLHKNLRFFRIAGLMAFILGLLWGLLGSIGEQGPLMVGTGISLMLGASLILICDLFNQLRLDLYAHFVNKK